MKDQADAIADGLDPAVEAAWTRVFGGPVDPDHSLYDWMTPALGIERSVQVHRFLADVSAATGLDLPLTVVFEAPTPRKLSEVVRRRAWAPFERPILMRPGVGDPLFIVPGVGGMALDMLEILPNLRFPGPFRIGQPRGLDGAEPPLSTMDAIALDQIALLRKVQPHGPYRILGYSWGGLVGLEMARRLQAENEQIAFVGLIEPELSEADWPFPVWLEYSARRASLHLAKIRRMSAGEAVGYAIGRIRPVVGRMGRKLGIDRPFGWSPYDYPGLPGILDVIWNAEVAAGDPYRMTPYDGRISLFASRAGHAALCDPRKVWPRYVRELDLHWSEGDHMAMMRPPNVQILAEQISACLEAA